MNSSEEQINKWAEQKSGKAVQRVVIDTDYYRDLNVDTAVSASRTALVWFKDGSYTGVDLHGFPRTSERGACRMNHFLHTVIEHTAMGAVFAGTGIYVRNMCEHLHHKLIVGTSLILAESIATVALIG